MPGSPTISKARSQCRTDPPGIDFIEEPLTTYEVLPLLVKLHCEVQNGQAMMPATKRERLPAGRCFNAGYKPFKSKAVLIF